MRTDRPDATESPYTVDVGHFQIESDFVSHVDDREAGEHVRQTKVAAFNVRMGVTRTTELGLFITPWTTRTESGPSLASRRTSGFGDLGLRAKFNLWGNDDGESAGGFIIDLSLPTADRGLGSDTVEGTLLIPFDFQLGGGWGLGAMSGVNVRGRPSGSGHRPVLITTATLSHDIAGQVGAYAEITSEVGDGSAVTAFDVGLTWAINSNLQLDVGANIGLSTAATDLEVFAGASRRF
ncbi:MAG: transporter [Opitutus sp.]